VYFGTPGTPPVPNGLYSDGHTYGVFRNVESLGGPNRIRLQAYRTDNADFTAVVGDYIVRVNFTLLKPGHSAIEVIGANLQRLNPPAPEYVYPCKGEVKAYLGDVARAGDMSRGDGRTDFEDLSAWSLSYWSGVSGYSGGMANYRVKYDFGPTTDHYVFSLPVPDQKIDFEDLMIFSISYGLTAFHQLPKQPAASDKPLAVSLGRARSAGNEILLPVLVTGGVADLRGLRLELNGQSGKYLGVEKGELLKGYSTPVVVMGKAGGNSIDLHCAVMGLDASGVSSEGEIAVIRFSAPPMMHLATAEGRSSRNTIIESRIVKGEGDVEPTVYRLSQNYPNPFNPSTIIEYEIPRAGMVTLEIFNLLGERVTLLVDEPKEPGFYQVVWRGTDDRNVTLATGVYFCRIRSGDFTSVKNMLLIR
jgi:hypothetical protein